MKRRRILAVLGSTTTGALAGCGAHVRGPSEGTTTDEFHRNPTVRPFPDHPGRVSNASVVEFASEYEHARLHNEEVEDGATRVDLGCSGRVAAATEEARYVLVDCGGAVYHGTAVGDWFPGLHAAYRVASGGFTDVDEWSRATDEELDATIETARAATGTTVGAANGTSTVGTTARSANGTGAVGTSTSSAAEDADGRVASLGVGNFDDGHRGVEVAVERASIMDGAEFAGATYTLPAKHGVVQRLRVPDGVEVTVSIDDDAGGALAFDWTPDGTVGSVSAAAFITPNRSLVGGAVSADR